MGQERSATHFDRSGRARMVDVGGKEPTRRTAVAEGYLWVGREVAEAVAQGRVPKGNAVEVARLAGICAAKRTWELVPLCHQLALEWVDVQIELEQERLHIVAEARARGPTGVEMEALTAVSTAGLALYDMLKALGKTMRLEGVRLLYKAGGRSGEWRAPGYEPPHSG